MNETERLEKLLGFIQDNKLNFNQTDSGLNGHCTVLCGYGLHIGADRDEITEAAKKSFIKIPNDFHKLCREINEVYYVAKRNNYGKFWKTEKATKMYKF